MSINFYSEAFWLHVKLNAAGCCPITCVYTYGKSYTLSDLIMYFWKAAAAYVPIIERGNPSGIKGPVGTNGSLSLGV